MFSLTTENLVFPDSHVTFLMNYLHVVYIALPLVNKALSLQQNNQTLTIRFCEVYQYEMHMCIVFILIALLRKHVCR